MEAPKLEGAAALGYDTGALQGEFPQGELVPERWRGAVHRVPGQGGASEMGKQLFPHFPFQPSVEGEKPSTSHPVSGHPAHTPGARGETEAVIACHHKGQSSGRGSIALWSSAPLCDLEKVTESLWALV